MTKEIENLIKLYKPLDDWFERNKETIHTIIESEDTTSNLSTSVTNSMLNCAYRWLRTSEVESEFTPNSPEFKIASAVMGMAHIYNSNADKLTPDEQANLRISYNVEGYAKTM